MKCQGLFSGKNKMSSVENFTQSAKRKSPVIVRNDILLNFFPVSTYITKII